LGVVGHVEHITLGRVDHLPRAGEIVHLEALRWFPGGGSGVPFWQLVNGPTEVHLFTALGNDEAGRAVAEELARAGAHVHAARRAEPHTRNVVMVTPDAERTILVLGAPQQPRRDDDLPWELLASCDAAYFTARDPEALRAARAARVLVVTSRRAEVLAASGVRADVVVGSALDAVESRRLADYPVPPGALVLTEGAAGGRVETAAGVVRFAAAAPPPRLGGAYGAGDSFAAAFTFYLAAGLGVAGACARAGQHGAAVMGGLDPRAHQLPLTWPG
jgi:ribokinase